MALSKKILLIISLLLAPCFVMAVETTSTVPVPVSSNGGVSSSQDIDSTSVIGLNGEPKKYSDSEYINEPVSAEYTAPRLIFDMFLIEQIFLYIGITIIFISFFTINLKIAAIGLITVFMPPISEVAVALAETTSTAIFFIEPSEAENNHWPFLIFIGAFIMIAAFILLWANELPNKVLRYIGGGQENPGEAQNEQPETNNESESNEIQTVVDSSSSEVDKLKRKVSL